MRRSPAQLVWPLLVASVLLAGCSAGIPGPTIEGPLPTEPEPLKLHGRVVFDMAHGEVFGAQDTSALGQSAAVERIANAGFDVEVNESRFTTESVDGAAGIILPGAMRLPTFDEQDVLEAYVRGGGVLVITTHVSYPLMTLPERYGMGLTPLVITSDNPLPGADSGSFLATTVAPHPLTEGIEQLLVISSWAVTADGPDAHVAVSSDADTWADDGDHRRTAADPVGPLGIVAFARLGEGTVVLIGDDAVFANGAIGHEGNARLLDNILDLMGASALGA